MIEVILPNKKLLSPCFGINRALKECEALENKNHYIIYGPPAHNRRFVKKICESGLSYMKGLDRDTNVIIRAHGITKKDISVSKKHTAAKGVVMEGSTLRTCPEIGT